MANECPFCGEPQKPKGLHFHKRFCKMNPDRELTKAEKETQEPESPPEPPADFPYTNRFERANKCPMCRTVFRSFRIMSEDVLCCLDCGMIFTTAAVRERWRAEIKAIAWPHPK